MNADVTRFQQALEQALELVEEPERRAALERFLRAARPYLEEALRGLLVEAAEAVNQATEGRYEAMVVSDSQGTRLEIAPRAEAEKAAEGPWPFSQEDVDRITLRLPGELKEMIARMAEEAGLSVNLWINQALARQFGAGQPAGEGHPGRHRRRGRRMHGWVGPEG